MGFIKSVHQLQKQSKEIQRNHDVGAQLADAQAKMAGANQLMAQQTAAANAAATGLDAHATVVASRDAGAMFNMQPLIELDLTVLPPGRPPYPATVKQAVPQVNLAMVHPGSSLRVKVAHEDPNSVWIDFVGSSLPTGAPPGDPPPAVA